MKKDHQQKIMLQENNKNLLKLMQKRQQMKYERNMVKITKY